MFPFLWQTNWQQFLSRPVYTLDVLTEPTEEPVSVDEFALWARANTDAEAALYPDVLAMARMAFEHLSGYTCVRTKFRQYSTTFDRPVTLWRGKTTSIDSIHYYDASDSLTAVGSYRQDLTNTTGRVWLDSYPATTIHLQPVVYVDFWAGNADAAHCPKDIKIAVRQLAAHLFWNREAQTDVKFTDLPMGFCDVVAKYNTGVLGW